MPFPPSFPLLHCAILSVRRSELSATPNPSQFLFLTCGRATIFFIVRLTRQSCLSAHTPPLASVLFDDPSRFAYAVTAPTAIIRSRIYGPSSREKSRQACHRWSVPPRLTSRHHSNATWATTICDSVRLPTESVSLSWQPDKVKVLNPPKLRCPAKRPLLKTRSGQQPRSIGSRKAPQIDHKKWVHVFLVFPLRGRERRNISWKTARK